MSYDFKQPWEVKREGENAYERGEGRGGNPYTDDRFSYEGGQRYDEWDRGYRTAEAIAEERRLQEREAERYKRQREEEQRREEDERQRWEQAQNDQNEAYYAEQQARAAEHDAEHGPEEGE